MGSNRNGRRSSIVDVARLAGVSKQTVSNVLNDRVGYTPETRIRVLEAMRSLDYQPSQAARSLRSRKTMQLAYHMRESQLAIHTGFTISLLHSLIAAATRRGYHLLVFSEASAGELGSFDGLIASGAVDGFLLSDLRSGDPRPQLLAERGVPFATFGRLAPELPQHWIDIDNAAAVGDVVDYLVGAGHRDLAFVGPDDGEYWSEERERGFHAAMAKHGLRVRKSHMFSGSRSEAREFASRLLTRSGRPSAVVTSNDAVGADVVNTAHSVGLVVGEEVAVTGFGGGLVTQVTHPTLTTVQIPVEDVARLLVDLCLKAAAGVAPDEPVTVATRLWRGGSA